MTAVAGATDWRFEAIGTRWQITADGVISPEARESVRALIASFDEEWSRFRDDSRVTALARGAQSVPAPADAEAMLSAYAEVSAATGGAVNPLVGDALISRGYDAGYSFTDRGPRPSAGDWTTRLTWTEGELSLASPAVIDIGALGKGRLVDRVLEVLADTHDGAITVDASGDMAVRGRTERVALEHPYDARKAIGVWEIADAALCASAVNRRAWGEGLHHVLDARTGEPVRTIAATWAVAPTAMHADAVATALFFDGGPELAHGWNVQWVRMTTDGAVEWSPGCAAELFIRR